MKDFLAWNPTDLETIPFDEMVFATDIEFTKNRLYHAVAILFFLHPTLPTNYQELSDAIHAGWMATFKHPMNFEELRLPPSVGPDAYTDEEQKWCDGTLNWLVANLDVAARQSRGIPESAVKQRAPRGRHRPRPSPRPRGTNGPRTRRWRRRTGWAGGWTSDSAGRGSNGGHHRGPKGHRIGQRDDGDNSTQSSQEREEPIQVPSFWSFFCHV